MGKVAVTSSSFSKHPELIEAMESSFVSYKLNTEGTRFSTQELIEYLTGYDAAIIGLDEINDEVLKALPDLKIIAKYGVGLNNIDQKACENHGVLIGWTGGVNKLSVAEMTLGNILVLSRNIYQSSIQLSNGNWIKNGGSQLTGKKVGIIGVGHIGKEVIRLLKPFNCEIYVNDILDQELYYAENNLIESSKEMIYQDCDVISLHIPYDEKTSNLIDVSALNKMMTGVVLVNSSRGGIVDEKALKTKLLNNQMSAAIDVFVDEPASDLEMLSLPNLLCTPHIGGNSTEAVKLMGVSAIGHLIKYFRD